MKYSIARQANRIDMARAVLLALFASLLLACQADEPVPLSPLDRTYYESCVEPIVVKRCGMLACHGNADRFYRVFSRNRFRIDKDPAKRDAVITEEERTFNYEAAIAMVDPQDLDKSLLLMKPLDGDRGGYIHDGATEFNQGDVFVDEEDPEFQILSKFARGQKGADCRK